VKITVVGLCFLWWKPPAQRPPHTHKHTSRKRYILVLQKMKFTKFVIQLVSWGAKPV